MGESFLLTLLVSSYFLSLSAYLLPWDRNISHITEQSNRLKVILHCSSAYFLYFYSFLLVLKVLDNDTKCPSIIIFCLFTEGFGTLCHGSGRDTNKIEKHLQSPSTFFSS